MLFFSVSPTGFGSGDRCTSVASPCGDCSFALNNRSHCVHDVRSFPCFQDSASRGSPCPLGKFRLHRDVPRDFYHCLVDYEVLGSKRLKRPPPVLSARTGTSCTVTCADGYEIQFGAQGAQECVLSAAGTGVATPKYPTWPTCIASHVRPVTVAEDCMRDPLA